MSFISIAFLGPNIPEIRQFKKPAKMTERNSLARPEATLDSSTAESCAAGGAGEPRPGGQSAPSSRRSNSSCVTVDSATNAPETLPRSLLRLSSPRAP